LRCGLVSLVLILLAATAAPAQSPDVDRLIEQLGSSRWEEREAASKRLPELGEAALPAMEKAARSDRDVDVRLRLWLAIRSVRERGYGEVAVITGKSPGYWLNRVAFTEDGKQVVAAGGAVIWFDPATRKEVRRALEVNGARHGLRLTADGKRLLTAHTTQTPLHLCETATGTSLKTLRGHTGGILAVDLANDGTRAVSAGTDRTLRLWDVEAGKELRQCKPVPAAADSVALSSDGKRLASGHQAPDNRVRLWNVETGEMLRELAGHTGRVHAVRFLPDGKSLLSASADGTLRLWDVEKGDELRVMKHGGIVYDLALSPEGARALSAGFDDHTVALWDLTTGKLLHRFIGHGTRVIGVAFSPDGKRAASSDANCTVRIWRITK
jgi:WD40 repeat protein